MGFVFDVQSVESPFVEMFWRTRSACTGTFLSRAVSNWELVVMTCHGERRISVRGPETCATQADFPADAEFFGITFKLGSFLPQLPIRTLLDRRDATLPQASQTSFWLHGSRWELPTFDNAEIFVNRLIRQGLLVRDPLVQAVLQGNPPALSIRALQYRFIQATGLSHKMIQQIARAHAAVALLGQGQPIGTTAYELGYCDQAHLTKALKRFIGKTPAQVVAQAKAGHSG